MCAFDRRRICGLIFNGIFLSVKIDGIASLGKLAYYTK